MVSFKIGEELLEDKEASPERRKGELVKQNPKEFYVNDHSPSPDFTVPCHFKICTHYWKLFKNNWITEKKWVNNRILKEKKMSEEKKGPSDWKWRVRQKKQKRIQQLRERGFGMKGVIWKKKKKTAKHSLFLHYHLEIASLTWQEVQKKRRRNSTQI